MLKTVRLAAEAAFVAAGILLVVAPTVVLLHGPWEAWGGNSGGSAWAILLRPGTRAILGHTLLLGVLVTLIAAALGVLLVILLRRLPGRGVVWLLPLILAPLLADQLARNYGWYLLLRTDGVVNRALLALGVTDAPVQWLYRLGTVGTAMVQGLFPLATLPLLLAVQFTDPAVVVTARALGAQRGQILWRIVGPLVAPGLVLGVCFVFSASFGYFITPRMLGGDAGLTVAGLLEQRVNLLLDWPGSTALGSVMATVSLMGVVIFVFALCRLEPVPGFTAVPQSQAPVRTVVRASAAALVLCILLLAPLLPVAGASITEARHLSFPPVGFSLRWYAKALSDPDWASAWRVSLLAATVSATFACVLGAGAVALSARWKRGATVCLVVAALPLLLPPIAHAVGLYRVLVGVGLSGEWFRLVAGHAARALPYPALFLLLAWKAVDPALLAAVKVYGSDRLYAWMRALGPHFLPPLAIAYLLSWLVSFNDLELALFLSGPGSTTLPMRLWSGLHYSIEPTVAACAVLTTAGGLLFLGLVAWLLPAVPFRASTAGPVV